MEGRRGIRSGAGGGGRSGGRSGSRSSRSVSRRRYGGRIGGRGGGGRSGGSGSGSRNALPYGGGSGSLYVNSTCMSKSTNTTTKTINGRTVTIKKFVQI